SIFVFLNAIGAILGPVAGVMIVHFYIVSRRHIDIDKLYFDLRVKDQKIPRINISAYIGTIAGVVISLLGFLPGFTVISDFSWFIGFIVAGGVYIILHYVFHADKSKKEGVAYNEV
ncbi:cytosine permease, partial [Mammaliicoccus sciuri]